MTADFRQALRLFARRRGYTATILITLALGIGANTATFSLVRAVLLRPLPYTEPDRLVFVWEQRASQPPSHESHGILTGDYVMAWRDTRSLSSAAVMQLWNTNRTPRLDLATASGADRLRGAFVTANFFDVLGVRASIGRTFSPQDETSDLAPAIVSDGLWRRRFGADSNVIGQSVDLVNETGRRRYTIIGVLPAAFRFTYPLETEVWAIEPGSVLTRRRALEYQMVARLAPGVSPEQAESELTPRLHDVLRGWRVPEDRLDQSRALVEPVVEHLQADVRPGVLLILAGAGVVMLIACVNVALLLIALHVDRRREMTLRAAIGAGSWRLARQLLTESTILATAGAAVGIGLAWLLLPAFQALIPPQVPRGDELSVDLQVLALVVATTVLTSVVCGMAPVWHVRAPILDSELRRAGTAVAGDRRVTRWRDSVLVGQVAVVSALLVTASLLLQSFWHLQQVDLGFAAGDIIALEMRLLSPRYRQEGRIAEYERAVVERVRALPGVAEVGLTTAVPMRGTDWMVALPSPDGRGGRRFANLRSVDPAFFSVMGMSLVSGRMFSSADTENAPKVAIVSQSYARSLYGEVNAIGRQLNLEPGTAEIIGVVRDVRYVGVTREAGPALYLPRAQRPSELVCVVVRPTTNTSAIVAAVRAAVQSVDPAQPVENASTIGGIVRENTASERFYTVTTSGFAGAALLLAVCGVAGVVSRTVTERLRELAIRLAVGANAGRLVARAVARAMSPVTLGLAIGLLGAWSASRLVQQFLFEVSAVNLLAYAVSASVLALAAGAASYIAARRVRRLEVTAILKME